MAEKLTDIGDDKTQINPSPMPQSSETTRRRSLRGVYEYFLGKRNDLDIWFVNGTFIRRKIVSEFVYGGNDRVYNFIPKGEIWIDSSTDPVEAQYTIEHELLERQLMAEKGLSYDQAHKLASEQEQKLRAKNHELIEQKEKETLRVPFSLSESRKLSNGSPLE